jgi:chemotaxis protein methyltransferase CheR
VLNDLRGCEEGYDSGLLNLQLSGAQFATIQKLAYDTFGLDLKPGKESLVVARLAKRLRALQLPDIGAYLRYLAQERSGEELSLLIDSLTTNFTSFLREKAHFDLMRERILPEIARKGEIAIWSAGCATGEEPYTILFHLIETLGEPLPSRLKLLATDISTKALAAARAGVYPERRLEEIPPEWARRFLQRGVGGQAGLVRVKPQYQSMIAFGRRNLMEPFDEVGRFHVIFCRNVMIYFDRPTQESLVQRFARQLVPGGWLLIGHSEGLVGMNHGLDHIRPAVYRNTAGLAAGRRA